MGSPAWAEDVKFSTLKNRLNNKEELDGLIEAWTREHTAEEVMSVLQKNGVSAGMVQDAADIAQDPQLKARGFFIEGGEMPFTDASPVRMGEGGAEYKRAAPSPGQDNSYVYGNLLGMSKEEIAILKEKGVI
ncbi:MAG: hypothetical protein A2Y90_01155 [Chloroflexi bacterium RBG_13_52_12]|nr:MAG: hypothetical protein A2Y90_01155 [Chloroflexi bacterium RBG_13_52_12]